MKRVVGLLDNYDDAEATVDDLTAEGVTREAVHILKRDETVREDREGMWDRIKGFFGADVPEEDAGYYAEGVSRKGVVVAVDVPDELAERAMVIMDEHGAVDIDKRAAEWKESGWTGYEGSPRDQGKVIPVAEEEVKIGKREVSRGGVRVYSRVIETPIEEDVRLREERARVERRRVDRPASEEAFRETSIEVEEISEEPVVSKQARVKEEVIVGKEATERTQRVRETERRTQVDVERQRATTSPYSEDFRKHFQSSPYSAKGESYDAYDPAYTYGSTLARDKRYQGKLWGDVEEDVHSNWEQQHPGTWDRFKNAIRYGWDRATGK